jgi:hypothetical protein
MALPQLSDPSCNLVGAADLRTIFADRWLKSLPRRWARNGAVFGIICSYAQVGGSKIWEELAYSRYDLLRFIFVLVVMPLGSALIFLVLGLWARRALSPVSGTANGLPLRDQSCGNGYLAPISLGS